MGKLVKMATVAVATMMVVFGGKGMIAEAAEDNPDRFMERTVYVSTEAEVIVAIEEAFADQAPAVNIYRNADYSGRSISGIVYSFLYENIQTYGAANKSGSSHIMGGGCNRVELDYLTTPAEELYLDAIAEQIAILTEGYTDYQKVRYVHDYICNMTTYDNDTANRLADYRSAYDALANGKTVCSGYALLFQRFMERLHIPCRYYSGTIGGGRPHAWNIVYLDGLWYHIDCTWADQDWGISNSYFLIGTDRMVYPENGYAMAACRYPY